MRELGDCTTRLSGVMIYTYSMSMPPKALRQLTAICCRVPRAPLQLTAQPVNINKELRMAIITNYRKDDPPDPAAPRACSDSCNTVEIGDC